MEWDDEEGGSVPATVERDPGFRSAVIEFEIQRSHVGLEGQSRGRSRGAEVIQSGRIRELAPNSNACVVWDIANRPRGHAVWIAVVASLAGVCVVYSTAVVIHFFARIILMDIHPVAGQAVDKILTE